MGGKVRCNQVHTDEYSRRRIGWQLFSSYYGFGLTRLRILTRRRRVPSILRPEGRLLKGFRWQENVRVLDEIGFDRLKPRDRREFLHRWVVQIDMEPAATIPDSAGLRRAREFVTYVFARFRAERDGSREFDLPSKSGRRPSDKFAHGWIRGRVEGGIEAKKRLCCGKGSGLTTFPAIWMSPPAWRPCALVSVAGVWAERSAWTMPRSVTTVTE